MRKRRITGKAELAEHAAILKRVGVDPEDRLRWLVGRLEENRRTLTAGGREDLRSELAVFATGPRALVEFTTDGRLDRPTDEQVKPILEALFPIVQAAIRRERVPVGRRATEVSLVWDAKRGRFTLWQDDDDPDWRPRARRALADAILRAGHLLRECPAPLPRDKDAPCGAWFVASRPRQRYCTPQCQSRVGTQRHRKGGR